MNVAQYCQLLGWSQNDLKRQAGLHFDTAHKAFIGKPVSHHTAQKIARAFSEALNQDIQVGKIEGLSLRG